MPGLDRTGPQGQGAMSGGGRGQCMTDKPATEGRFVRRGMGLGRGWVRGMGRGSGVGRGLGAGARRGWLR
jgi:hypothetical protein